MKAKKTKSPPKPKFLDVRVRFTAEELELVKSAAASRGLGFNLFMRLVSVGTAKRVLTETPKEELIGRYLDSDSAIRGRLSLDPLE